MQGNAPPGVIPPNVTPGSTTPQCSSCGVSNRSFFKRHLHRHGGLVEIKVALNLNHVLNFEIIKINEVPGHKGPPNILYNMFALGKSRKEQVKGSQRFILASSMDIS